MEDKGVDFGWRLNGIWSDVINTDNGPESLIILYSYENIVF